VLSGKTASDLTERLESCNPAACLCREVYCAAQQAEPWYWAPNSSFSLGWKPLRCAPPPTAPCQPWMDACGAVSLVPPSWTLTNCTEKHEPCWGLATQHTHTHTPHRLSSALGEGVRGGGAYLCVVFWQDFD